MFAKRSTQTATSGRRRAKPRTYPSTSAASLAKPPLGRDLGGVVSVKTAGSRGAEPYTLVLDLTTNRWTVGDFWQAPSSCMVPMTFVSLIAVRPPAPSAFPETSRWTTVSTECSASTRAIAGCRTSARTNTASPSGCGGVVASTAITRSTPASRWTRRTKRPPSCRAAPVTSTIFPKTSAFRRSFVRGAGVFPSGVTVVAGRCAVATPWRPLPNRWREPHRRRRKAPGEGGGGRRLGKAPEESAWEERRRTAGAASAPDATKPSHQDGGRASDSRTAFAYFLLRR